MLLLLPPPAVTRLFTAAYIHAYSPEIVSCLAWNHNVASAAAISGCQSDFWVNNDGNARLLLLFFYLLDCNDLR